MKTQDVNQITKKQFADGSGRYSTNFCFFYKDGGVKYYIDEMDKDGLILHIRNSRNGNLDIIYPNRMSESRYGNSFYFQSN